MKSKWSTLFLILFIVTAGIFCALSLPLDIVEIDANNACQDAGYDGWTRVDGEGYCWQTTESVPILVEDVQ